MKLVLVITGTRGVISAAALLAGANLTRSMYKSRKIKRRPPSMTH